MLGTDLGLKHQAALLRHNEFLAEAKLQHEIDMAYAENGRIRPGIVSEARAAIATLLLRAGSWLMPQESVRTPGRGAAKTLELRPGQ